MKRAAVILCVSVVACGQSTAEKSRPAASASAATSDTTPLLAGADLHGRSLEQLQRMRATIFGRHGRVFQDSALQGWLAAQSWYRPDTTFTNDRLSDREREQLDLVREAEAALHAHVEPGDMRFHQDRVITSAMLGTHSPQDWEVLSAEVLANHGFVFHEDDEEDDDERNSVMSSEALQRYFDERYWYRRDARFMADQLSPIERQNLDTITVAMTRQLGRAISPGMMNLFAKTPLTAASLRNVSIADLRLLRNEVYARHGRVFQNPWVRERMAREPWYRPRGDFSESELSEVERANIALITAREAALHDELGTRLLTVPELRGLPPEDARRLRNEIFARHGRRFKDAALQRYFSSFPWYQPNDAFSESSLNATERRNVDLISQYESGRFTEG